MMLTESTSTQQSHSKNVFFLDQLVSNNQNSILKPHEKKTLFKYDSLSTCIEEDNQQNNDYLDITSEQSTPIIKIDLDLNDETTEENSLAEIFFKRIITPESNSYKLSTNQFNILI